LLILVSFIASGSGSAVLEPDPDQGEPNQIGPGFPTLVLDDKIIVENLPKIQCCGTVTIY
jgi:hypothetical protein